MSKFIIARTLPPLSGEEMGAAAKRSIEVAQGMPGLGWIRSYFAANEGKMWCEYEAPNTEACYEHAKKAGLPIDAVFEVAEIDPASFK